MKFDLKKPLVEEEEDMVEVNTAEAMNGEVHDIITLLSSPERDFLVRNNGDEVIMSHL